MAMARANQRRMVRPRRTVRSVPVLSHLAESAPIAMMVLGPTGDVRYFNPAFVRLLGHEFSAGHILGEVDVVHESDEGSLWLHIDRLARGETDQYRGEHKLRHSDGYPVWVLIAAAVARGETGDAENIIIQFNNIELQKRAEEALAYSENRWNSALENAGQGVWDYDIRRDTMFYSPVWKRMRGIPEDEEIGIDHNESWLSRVHPDDVARLREHGRKQGQGEQGFDTLEYRERRRDGRYIWILSRGGPIEWDETGKVLRAVGTDTDITSLKTIEQELAAEKERLRVTLKAVADGMIATDDGGRVSFINPAAERFTGFSAEDAKGLLVEQVLPLRYPQTEEAAPCPAMTCLRLEQTIEVADEILLVARDGIAREIRCLASPVKTPDGKVTGTVLVFQDVTQSRALQRQLAHSASHDDLTGLPNRVAFDRALAMAVASARDLKRRHTLLYIDLDRFKPVNDTAGHAAGDALLKQVAETIRGACRGHDLAARLGGDEFAVLLEDCPIENGVLVGQKIVRAIASLVFAWSGREYRIGASIGAAEITQRTPSSLGFLGEADAACYAAKAGGRGMVVSYADLPEA